MDKIPIIQKRNNILRKIAKEVPLEEVKSATIQNIIKKMKLAVSEREEAAAVAAPQIGQSLRIFVITNSIFFPKTEGKKEEKKKTDYGFTIFINPKILKKSREQKLMTEGCLSVENIYGTIKRSDKIKVEAYDENGKKFIKSGSGLFAQVIQHEMDHLDGILFTDKAIMLRKYDK
ncbi:MAG: peptide deformylase [bacterium]|nr:peptide deformylase [bacterium]